VGSGVGAAVTLGEPVGDAVPLPVGVGLWLTPSA
jgi:hypothetical protein